MLTLYCIFYLRDRDDPSIYKGQNRWPHSVPCSEVPLYYYSLRKHTRHNRFHSKNPNLCYKINNDQIKVRVSQGLNTKSITLAHNFWLLSSS